MQNLLERQHVHFKEDNGTYPILLRWAPNEKFGDRCRLRRVQPLFGSLKS